MTGSRTRLRVGGRDLEVSNRDKVLWPETGWTKGAMLDYYAAVAPVMVAHLRGRPITMRRWPDGVGGKSFFQKKAPAHRPPWIATVHLGDVDYLRIDEPAALMWAANLASIEIHPGLATATDLDRPTAVVLDLDPGPPADAVTCARVATILRDRLDRVGLQAWIKTSGSKGLQMYVPLQGHATFAETRDFALALASAVEKDRPDLVLTDIDRASRQGRVLIDWAQNAPSRTTVAAYSLRARPEPGVSTPLTWDEVDDGLVSGDAGRFRFGPDEVRERVDRLGDLMAPVLTVGQELPRPGR